MKPFLLLVPILSFCAALALHIAVWRIRRPKNDILGLLVIFALLPASAAALLFLSRSHFGLGGSECAAILVLHLAIAAAYIQSYPPAQAVSPSLQILIYVGQSPDGLSRDQILALFDDAKMVSVRFQDLIHTGLIEPEGSAYRLSPAGRRLIGFFVAYRRWLGLEFKGG